MESNVASHLSKQADKNPQGDAIRYLNKQWNRGLFSRKSVYKKLSFYQLNQAVDSVLHILILKGIKKGSRVLLMVKPGLDLIQIVFALLKLGAIPIIIDPGMGLRRFFMAAKQSKAEFILGEILALYISKLFLRGVYPLKFISIGRNFKMSLKKYIGMNCYDSTPVKKDTLAAILFTSGSTGPAKGVCYTHSIFNAQIELIKKEYSINPGEVDLPMLAVFALFNPALGMCTVVPDMNPSKPSTLSAKKIVKSILLNQVTNSFGSPTLWKKVLDYCEKYKCNLPTLKRVIMAGAPVPQDLLCRLKEFLPNGEIFTPFGATEALPLTSASAKDINTKQVGAYAYGRQGIFVGRALFGVNIKIIESTENYIESIESAVNCRSRVVGEIIVSGINVTQKYDGLLNNGDISKIRDDGFYWHRMGDIGWIDDEGNLWFCGRKAERVRANSGFLDTVCCEAIFNQLKNVARSALIEVKGLPAIVIEPKKGSFPKSEREKNEFIKHLKNKAKSDSLTAGINEFYFEKSFPVDVRHNAKIHRLNLAKKFSQI